MMRKYKILLISVMFETIISVGIQCMALTMKTNCLLPPLPSLSGFFVNLK